MRPRRAGLDGELVYIDHLLQKWKKWATEALTHVGWAPTSLTAKMIEWHELGLEPEKLYPALGRDKAPDGVMLLDRCVAQLPSKLRRVIYTEYFTYGSNEVKARSLSMPTLVYRTNLRSSLWAIHGKIDGLHQTTERMQQ